MLDFRRVSLAWRIARRFHQIYTVRGPKQYRARVRGHTFILRADNPILYYRASTYETKEPETLDWMDAHVNLGDIVWDIGANTGLYSLYAARVRRARVWAFEPSSANLACLIDHIVWNRAEGVTACAVALSNRTGLNLLQLHTVQAGSSLHAFGDPIDWTGAVFRPAAQELVYGATLDSLVDEGHLPAPQHLKIDVDGLEPQILEGAHATLASPTLKSILIEIEEGAGHKDIQACLESHSFVSARQAPVWYDNRVVAHNHVFVRP